MSCVFKRHHAANHRQPGGVDALQEGLERPQVEDRPGDHELGTRLDLVFEPPQLLIEVGRGRVERDADMERRGRADRLAADVAAVIQAGDDVGEAD